eukprot:gene1080-1071_t
MTGYAGTKRIALFDMDGTLTKPRNPAKQDMLDCLDRMRQMDGVAIGIVSGSDLPKIEEQLTVDPHKCFDYVFPENGTIAYKDGKLIEACSMKDFLGEEKLQDLLNFVLGHFATVRLPKKRGTFVEYRNGMLNFSPIGRKCTQEERDEFAAYDAEHKIRETFVAAAREKFGSQGLTFSIGGQISVDCFPNGWDKTKCLQYVEAEYGGNIHFYGDKTGKGGNDHEIFEDPRTHGHTVVSPEDTMQQLNKEFGVTI